MDCESPPKRITRSRAVAKATTSEPEVKITTAAAKARATRNIVSTITKRKTRADEVPEEASSKDVTENKPADEAAVKPKATRGRKRVIQAEPEILPNLEVLAKEEPPLPTMVPVKATRGRPKKIVEEAPPSEPLKPNRGRQRKVAVDEDVSVEPAPERVQKITRGRPGASSKSVIVEESAMEAAPEPAKKVTRGRPPTAPKPGPAPKKTVKFEEAQLQDKENIIPLESTRTRGKDVETGTGLRARPVRKAAVSTRAVRGRAKAEAGAEKHPLTPKKATQVATAKENLSEDELATMEKTPLKPLTKSPFKAPGVILGSNKKLDFTTSIIANRADTQDYGASLMGSPARRPPPSPFKDSMKTSPKRVDMGNSMMRSPFKTSMLPPNSSTSPFKGSLLRSPAKRPQSPTKVSITGSPSRDKSTFGVTPKGGEFSVSRFNATPRTLTKPAVRLGRSFLFSPLKDATSDQTPSAPNLNVTAIASFPGRLSSILPRNADPAMGEPVEAIDAQETIPNDNLTSEGLPAHQILEEPMSVEEDQHATDTVIDEEQSTTPTHSPPRYSIGNFNLCGERDPFEESDSEDELASGSPKYSPVPLKVFNISSKDFANASTPTSTVTLQKTPKTAVIYKTPSDLFHGAARSQSVRARKETDSSTPSTRQLSDWTSAATMHGPLLPSPSVDETDKRDAKSFESDEALNIDDGAVLQLSPTKSSFFDDAMSVSNPVIDQANDDPVSGDIDEGLDAIDFAPTALDEEDLALAAEADEMSLISIHTEEDVEQAVDEFSRSTQGEIRTVSEASQEYGDENAPPADQTQTVIDPTLLALDAQQISITSTSSQPPVFTPVRVLGERERVFHTVSKVPLKPAAEDSPLKITKRSASAFRMPAQRHAPLPPSFVVPKLPQFGSPAVSTPVRSNNWSTAVTPVRTPRRDVNELVLKGAVVFVDVHTTEGADASAVFVDLLGQMGARCVKNWSWNPSNSSSSDAGGESKDEERESTVSSGKIGITHVVFKDGGKRTLEKVKESKGVVLCVGVGWVLDCERQQSWLPESHYKVDTALVPRGGSRRRKSMEPRSIHNRNGTLSIIPSTSGTPRSVSANQFASPAREQLNLPLDTPGAGSRSARRKSTLWIRSPSSDGDANADSRGDLDPMAGLMLSPVPVTPAPETISAYAEHVLDEMTPGKGGVTPYFLKREELVQRTCPPKRTGGAVGEGEMGFGTGDFEGLGVVQSAQERENGGVNGNGVLMQRLLLARRKSLQWAPKVGSPLAKGGFTRSGC